MACRQIAGTPYNDHRTAIISCKQSKFRLQMATVSPWSLRLNGAEQTDPFALLALKTTAPNKALSPNTGWRSNA